MSENEPPHLLSEAERQRLQESAQAHIAESERHARAAIEDLARLEADNVFRRQQPGTVFKFPERPSGWEGGGGE
jgi:hypothetical protein